MCETLSELENTKIALFSMCACSVVTCILIVVSMCSYVFSCVYVNCFVAPIIMAAAIKYAELHVLVMKLN